jgi:hypothetical protein
MKIYKGVIMKKLLVGAMVLVTFMLCSVNAAEKMFTIKGLYAPNLVINEKVSNSNYLGLGVDGRYNLNYRVEPGPGLAIEALVYNAENNNFEILGGANYMAERRVSHVRGSGKITSGGLTGTKTYDDVVDSSRIQTTAAYVKGRLLSGKPSKDGLVMYIAGKVSYDFVVLSGVLLDSTKLSNGVGYGGSVGAILADDFDIELSVDQIGAKAKFDDGFDSLNGTYAWQVVSLGVGIRI